MTRFLLRLYLARFIDEGDLNLIAADVSGDGIVNDTDVFIIMLYLARLIDTFPVLL